MKSLMKGVGMNDCEQRGIGSSLRQTPVLERLKEQKAQLEKRLRDIDHAIGSLEANPEVQEVLEALNKLGSY